MDTLRPSASRPPMPLRMGAPPGLLQVDMMLSPGPTSRTLDQASPHFRPFPTEPALATSELEACDLAGSRDQTRRKPARFSTTSLPDVDW
jgi:hypothetical protein